MSTTAAIPLVLNATDATKAPAAWIGGKAFHLAQLGTSAATLPGFVVTTAAWQLMLGEDQTRLLSDSAAMVQQHLTSHPVPDRLQLAVREAAAPLFAAGHHLVVRSSAVGEDGTELSFAGIYDSVLGVHDETSLWQAIRQVWRSALGERALAYRQRHGLNPIAAGMAVLVQPQIDTTAAGVCFTCHPVTGDRSELWLHALWGLGEGLVSRGLAADTYRVDRETLQVESELADKRICLLRAAGGGVHIQEVDEARRRCASLSEEQVQHVARRALEIEALLGAPQDIEFGIRDGLCHIFQTRGITTTHVTDTTGDIPPSPHVQQHNHQIWDNSNIIESYSGVTTPMTFSFIRRAYSIVYRCFAEVMGIAPAHVESHRDAFDNMLGMFRGRVYYNLKNWYRLVRLFPGYQYNRQFMETMMGVKQSLTLDDERPPVGMLQRWFVEFPALLLLVARCLWNFARIRSIVSRFEQHFARHYDAWSRIDFADMPPHRIAELYEMMEGKMLWNWKAPIINDFYVMVFYGILKQLCQKWCGDASGTLQNGLVCGQGGLQSEAPARLLMQMTDLANRDAELRRAILHDELAALPEQVSQAPQFADFQTLMQSFLDDFGLRSANELKLESFSYQDEPQRVYQLLRSYLKTDKATLWDVDLMAQREASVRQAAEATAWQALDAKYGWWYRRLLFRWVLSNARRGIANRENMRFSRTRIYGVLRRMLRAMGQTFAERGILTDAEDIFYLTLDEVWSYVRGTAVSANLQGLAAARRQEYAVYREHAAAPLPNRFETHNLPYQTLPRTPDTQATPVAAGVLQGIGCCPGVVRGSIQLVRDAHADLQFQGRILVAEHTDPGWVPLFPAFAGILVERGSVLSHSAIVAREMGIPTIVAVAGLTHRLRSGDVVEMDGTTGTIHIAGQATSIPADQSPETTVRPEPA